MGFPILLVIVDNGVHKIHHGFGDAEHPFYLVEPCVALEEIVGDSVPGAVVLQAEIMNIGPILGETRGTGLQLLESEALGLIP